MKKALNFILYTAACVVIFGLLALFLAPTIPYFGHYEVRIVKSGSMEPSIMTGAVAFIKAEPAYQLGDVITFASKGSDIPTSHRIVDVENNDGETKFITKGDANETADQALVSPVNILGKVLFSIPYLGFVLDYARQPMGFLFLVGIPALIIVLDEIEKIWKEIKKGKNKEQEKEELDILVISPFQSKSTKMTKAANIAKENIRKSHTSAKVLSGFVIIFSLTTFSLWGNDTISYYSSVALSSTNSLKARALDFVVTPTEKDFVITENGFGAENLLNFSVTNVGSRVLRFDIETVFADGNINLCQNILTETNLPLPYTGSLLNFNDVGNLMGGDWELKFDLNNSVALMNDDACAVNLKLRGYLSEFEKSNSFVVEKEIKLNFKVVLPIAPVPGEAISLPPAPVVDNNQVLSDVKTEIKPEEKKENDKEEGEEKGEGETEKVEEVPNPEENTVKDNELENKSEPLSLPESEDKKAESEPLSKADDKKADKKAESDNSADLPAAKTLGDTNNSDDATKNPAVSNNVAENSASSNDVANDSVPAEKAELSE